VGGPRLDCCEGGGAYNPPLRKGEGFRTSGPLVFRIARQALYPPAGGFTMADGNQEYPTVLGPDASFKGEMTFEKGLRLQGKLEGKINTAGRLHIAKEARMQADVDAGAIIVEGDVRGNLNAGDRIELKNSARYEGDLRASKLVVDEGAVF